MFIVFTVFYFKALMCFPVNKLALSLSLLQFNLTFPSMCSQISQLHSACVVISSCSSDLECLRQHCEGCGCNNSNNNMFTHLHTHTYTHTKHTSISICGVTCIWKCCALYTLWMKHLLVFYLWPALWQQQPAQAPWRLPSTLSSSSAHPLCQQATQAANQRAAGHMRSASTNDRVGSVAVGDGDRLGVAVGVSAWQHLNFEYEFWHLIISRGSSSSSSSSGSGVARSSLFAICCLPLRAVRGQFQLRADVSSRLTTIGAIGTEESLWERRKK